MRKIDLDRWGKYFAARDTGSPVEKAAKTARISLSAAYMFERNDPRSSGIEAASVLGVSMVAGMLVDQPLCEEARKALDDFAYFRMRYFGRKSTPWQERAAYDVLRALESGEKEYVVTNCPPGSGKSTLFTCDIPTWLIARNRSIRIQIGSRTERQARMYVTRIKRALERTSPLRADSDSLARGIAFDAEACLIDDFGEFRPEGRSDLWRAEALVVRQPDQTQVDDKEPTVSAWGQDSGFLGGRFDLVIWDDLVDSRNSRTEESREKLQEWFITEAETRLEPGGAFFLQGQRISRNDLYRFALDMNTLDGAKKYKHIVYKAHDEQLCDGKHDPRVAKPWPKGCLLDPYRIPWATLEAAKRNSARVYQIQYQQEDGEIEGGLVDPAWIYGGIDSEGYECPGSLDGQRRIGFIPDHLKNRGWSFVTVDPSPTNYWGIIWWVYDHETNIRYVIDIVNEKMNPEGFLSIDLDTFEFSGVIVDMFKESQEQGVPIRTVMVETNAAQRWLLQQPHVWKWMQVTGVTFVPHTTTVNKSDPKFGVESVGDFFRQGKVRLPHADIQARRKSGLLIEELTAYPDGDRDDLVMSTWFHTLAVNNHYPRRPGSRWQRQRPSWLSSGRGLNYAR